MSARFRRCLCVRMLSGLRGGIWCIVAARLRRGIVSRCVCVFFLAVSWTFQKPALHIKSPPESPDVFFFMLLLLLFTLLSHTKGVYIYIDMHSHFVTVCKRCVCACRIFQPSGQWATQSYLDNDCDQTKGELRSLMRRTFSASFVCQQQSPPSRLIINPAHRRRGSYTHINLSSVVKCDAQLSESTMCGVAKRHV